MRSPWGAARLKVVGAPGRKGRGSELTRSRFDPLYRVALETRFLPLRGRLSELRECDLGVVNNLLSTAAEASEAYKLWKKDVRKVATGGEAEDTLSGDSEGRQRARPVLLDMFKGIDSAAALAWSGYWRVLSPGDRRLIWNVLEPVGIFRIPKAADLSLRLKELTGLAVKFGSLLFNTDEEVRSGCFKKWKLFCHLNLLRDYKPRKSDADFVEDMRRWVTGHIDHKLDGSSALFLSYLRTGVNAFLEQGHPVARFRPMSVREWLSDPANWARSGTSDGPRLRVRTKRRGTWEVAFARKSKWATACAVTLGELEAIFWRPGKQSNKSLQKRELGKVRAVIAGDLANYLRQSYVSYWLEASLRGHPNTTLFFDSDQQLAMWMQSSQSMAQDNVKMPLDEGEYDHHVTWDMLDVADDCIRDYIVRHYPDPQTLPEVLRAFDLSHSSLRGGQVRVGKVEIPVEKGVLSGWRWTAFYDTLLNAGKLNGFRRYLLKKIGYDPVINAVSQGDDVKLLLKDEVGAIALWSCYVDSGFDVNPAKFFIARDRDEYLRQVTVLGNVTGYPARAYPSLLFRNPVTRELSPGEERIREQVNSWETLFSRLGYRCEDAEIKDVAGANNIPAAQVSAILHSPACIGGCGIPYEDGGYTVHRWLGVTKGQSHHTWQWSRVPPLASGLTRYGVTAEELSAVWADAVEPPSGTEVEYTPFALKEYEVFDGTRVCKPAPRPIQFPFANPLLPKSVASALSARMQRSKAADFESCFRAWADPSCYSEFSRLRNRCSLRTLKDWATGSLPFKTPILPGWSGLAVAHIYKQMAAQQWMQASMHARVSYRRILRAALQAEHDTWSYLNALPVRIGG